MFKFKWFLKAASRAFSCKATATAHATNSIFHYFTASSPSITASERRILMGRQSRGSVDIIGMCKRDNERVKRKLLFKPVELNGWNVEGKSSNVEGNSIVQVKGNSIVDRNEPVPMSTIVPATTPPTTLPIQNNFNNPQNNHDLFPFLSEEELKIFDSRIYE